MVGTRAGIPHLRNEVATDLPLNRRAVKMIGGRMEILGTIHEGCQRIELSGIPPNQVGVLVDQVAGERGQRDHSGVITAIDSENVIEKKIVGNTIAAAKHSYAVA